MWIVPPVGDALENASATIFRNHLRSLNQDGTQRRPLSDLFHASIVTPHGRGSSRP
jgi:hypothetical protein